MNWNCDFLKNYNGLTSVTRTKLGVKNWIYEMLLMTEINNIYLVRMHVHPTVVSALPCNIDDTICATKQHCWSSGFVITRAVLLKQYLYVRAVQSAFNLAFIILLSDSVYMINCTETMTVIALHVRQIACSLLSCLFGHLWEKTCVNNNTINTT